MPEEYKANEKIEFAKTQMSKVTLDSYYNVEKMDKNWVKGNFGELTKVVIPWLVKMLNTVHHRAQGVEIGGVRKFFDTAYKEFYFFEKAFWAIFCSPIVIYD